jgi:outer membrane immunogenic protein
LCNSGSTGVQLESAILDSRQIVALRKLTFPKEMNMPLRQLALAIALFAATGRSAQAQGARIEVHGGYERLSYKSFFSPSDSTFRPVNGAFYGLGVGYDAPIGDRVFVGIEGNVDFSTGSRCQVNPLILAPGIFESCFKPGRDISANVRMGVKLGGESTRFYGLAGYSNLRVKSYGQVNRAPPVTTVAENRDGVRIGAGLEHNFSERFYGKLEFRHSRYGNGLYRNQGLIGAGFRF